MAARCGGRVAKPGGLRRARDVAVLVVVDRKPLMGAVRAGHPVERLVDAVEHRERGVVTVDLGGVRVGGAARGVRMVGESGRLEQRRVAPAERSCPGGRRRAPVAGRGRALQRLVMVVDAVQRAQEHQRPGLCGDARQLARVAGCVQRVTGRGQFADQHRVVRTGLGPVQRLRTRRSTAIDTAPARSASSIRRSPAGRDPDRSSARSRTTRNGRPVAGRSSPSGVKCPS